MNERLAQLHVEAARFAKEKYPSDIVEWSICMSEKFAELIVAECLEIVNRKEYSYHEADPLWETAQLIKQHFGVEL